MICNKRKIIFNCLMLSLLITTSGATSAGEIFKCINVNAEVYYNDKPCSLTTIERKLKGVKDPEGGYVPPDFVADEEAKSSAGIVVGNVRDRNIEGTEKGISDISSQGGNSNGSNTPGKSQSGSQSSDSEMNSAEQSNSSSSSDSGNSSVKNSRTKANKKKHLSKLIAIEPSS